MKIGNVVNSNGIGNGILNLFQKGKGNTNFLSEVLQSFCNLDSVKNYFIKGQFVNIFVDTDAITRVPLSNDIYLLLKEIFSDHPADPSDFFSIYEKNFMFRFHDSNLFNNQKNCHDFLVNLIDFLHDELNMPINPQYDFNQISNPEYFNMKDKDFMIALFQEYFEQTQSSFISSNIFWIKKIRMECQQCHNVSYQFKIDKVFGFDIDKYMNYNQQKNRSQLTIENCFEYYNNGNPMNNFVCREPGCNSLNGNIWEQAYIPPKVLILYLNRNCQDGKPDVKYDKIFDIKHYIDKDTVSAIQKYGQKIPHMYELKSCILFTGQYYISYCCYKNNDQKIWYKYINEQRYYIDNNVIDNELKAFQPILLFYENNEFLSSNILADESKHYINQVNNNFNLSNNVQNNNQPILDILKHQDNVSKFMGFQANQLHSFNNFNLLDLLRFGDNNNSNNIFFPQANGQGAVNQNQSIINEGSQQNFNLLQQQQMLIQQGSGMIFYNPSINKNMYNYYNNYRQNQFNPQLNQINPQFQVQGNQNNQMQWHINFTLISEKYPLNNFYNSLVIINKNSTVQELIERFFQNTNISRNNIKYFTCNNNIINNYPQQSLESAGINNFCTVKAIKNE